MDKERLDYQNKMLSNSFRLELYNRAKEVDFKPVMPKLPRVYPEIGYKRTSLIGYFKRMENWIAKLVEKEYQHETDKRFDKKNNWLVEKPTSATTLKKTS